ncbi:hypothetical protein D3C79_753610 [compost metagenome]
MERRIEQSRQVSLKRVAWNTCCGGNLFVFHDSANGYQALAEGLIANRFAGVVCIPTLTRDFEFPLSQVCPIADARLVAAIRCLQVGHAINMHRP